MRPAEDIEKLIEQKKVHLSTSSEMDKQIFEDSFAAMDETMNAKVTAKRKNLWRIIMKSKITKFAAAAVIIIAVLIGINQFGGSIDGTGLALADVRQALDKVKYMRRGNHWSGSGISCFNRTDGYCVYVTSNPDRKHEYDPESGIITLSWPGDGYWGTRETPLETAKRQLDYLIKFSTKHEINKGNLDGQVVDVIKIYGTKEDSNEVITMWCDSQSHLPLEIKIRNRDVAIIYSYPEKAPADIYELGAPRSAVVVSTVPNEETQEVITKFYRARKAAYKYQNKENMFGYLTPERTGQIIENEYARQHGLICLEQFTQGKMFHESTFPSPQIRSHPSKFLYFFDPKKDYLWVRREEYMVPNANWQIDKNWLPKDHRKLKPQHITIDILEFDRGTDGVWFPVKIKESRCEK